MVAFIADNDEENFKVNDESKLFRLLNWIADMGIDGFGALPSADQVAEDHLRQSGGSIEDAVISIIKWRTKHAMMTGFITSIGGVITLPVTVPMSLLSSYAIAANSAAAIAYLRGYDIHSDQVRTMVLGCLLGGAIEKIFKGTGIAIGNKLCQNAIKKVPGRILIEINKKIGFRLLTKAGEKGAINLMKMVPLAGGLVGTTCDGLLVNNCGKTASKVFVKTEPDC